MIIIVILLLLACLFINSNNNNQVTEHFYFDPLWMGKSAISDIHGKTALDCYKLNNRDCTKYSNCGLCHKDGESTCIPGDEQGPFWKEDCQYWTHTNFYDRHMFGEAYTQTTRPTTHFYSEFEARWPSPKIRATLL